MTAFHAAFTAALNGDLESLEPHLVRDGRAPGAMAVYRNTAAKGRIDALEANFPTIVGMVGEDWFRAAAAAYVAAELGGSAVLADYGAGFPAWLAQFDPARDMPYLAPCARLDRAWTEAHLAADAPRLDARAAAAAGAGLAGRVMTLHPSARLFWFDWSAPSLWLAHRYPDDPAAGLDWRVAPQGLLIHRPDDAVVARPLDRAAWAFLDACRRGRPLAAAALAADRDLAGMAGLFARIIALEVLIPAEPESCP